MLEGLLIISSISFALAITFVGIKVLRDVRKGMKKQGIIKYIFKDK